jgi:leucyl aminopeptidase
MIDLIFILRDDKPQLVNSAFLIENISQLQSGIFSDREIDYIQHQIESKKKFITLNYYYHWNYIIISDPCDDLYKRAEELRKLGAKTAEHAKENQVNFVNVVDSLPQEMLSLSFVEGIALASYNFKKYLTESSRYKRFGRINLYSKHVTQDCIEKLEAIITATYKARDLVNEPASYLTANKLADEAMRIGSENSVSVQVFRKTEIQQMGMGGLLAVNKGSIEPPTFTVMEYKPENAVNEKPIVLVGKGVVYDSGGLSLKPTESMDDMKCDMAGAAVAMNVIATVARLEMPLHVIALIPSTDNRLSAESYAPGDIIKMHDGKTVEVMNTDAEGRLILADALSYAKQFTPELTINIATLTGSAMRAIGERGSVIMGNASDEIMGKMVESANKTHERVAVFPFWDDYAEELKSEIADLKNIGSNLAGAITAGKFLEKFAPNPLIHIDIAGTAFFKKPHSYYTHGATGIGVRLLVDFLESYIKNKKQ